MASQNTTVDVEDFDLTRYSISPVLSSLEGKQDNAFPNYNYGDPENPNKVSEKSDRLMVITGPIKMDKAGYVPKINGKYIKTEKDCLFFRLNNVSTEQSTVDLFEKVLIPLDKYHIKNINNGNKIIREKVKGKEMYKSDLDYLSFIKDPSTRPDQGEEKSPYPQYLNIIAKIPTPFEKDPQQIDEKNPKVDVKIYLTEPDGSIKDEPEEVKTYLDLKKYFVWNCTARFVLRFKKLWIKKTPDPKTKKRDCSLTIDCCMMLITEIPAGSSMNRLNANVFKRGGFTPKAVEAPKPKPQKVESDDDDDDEEDEVKPTANVVKNDAVSDDSDDSEVEEKPQKKAPPPKKPVKGKK